MNISQIPDNVLFNIFRFLSARDFIRCGHVNERFRKISIEATSQIKSIDLNDEIFENITERQLGWLFENCRTGLKKIKFRSHRPGFIAIFERFSFLKLIDLNLSYNDAYARDFGKFMRQNRNIEIFKCPTPLFRVIFPVDVISEKLVALDFQRADERFFLSATGRCPNLESLEIFYIPCGASSDTRLTAMLNAFFASCSKLRKFAVKNDSVFYEGRILLEALMRVDSFWRLNLREIAVGDVSELISDKFLCSFCDLEVVSFDGSNVTPNLLSKLASLPKLRRLNLSCCRQHWDMDQNLKLFVGSEILQHLEIRAACISPTTLKGFIRYCPQISFLLVGGIKEVETVQDAANFIRSLNEFPTSRSCRLAVRFSNTPYKIWESKEVTDALEEVQETLTFEIE